MTALKEKVAFVTGGSRGIGAATVRALTQLGARVAFTYSTSAAQADELVKTLAREGATALALQADSGEDGAVTRAIEATVAEFGALDIVVNNAGIFDAKPVQEATMADFDRTMTVNVRAVYEASSAAVRHMRAGGTIINIGSGFAVRSPMPGLSLYSTSKAALVGMTKALARDLGPSDITVNIVHPGSTDTDMNPRNGDGAEEQLAWTATGRFAEPEDIASLIAWLASAQARSVTGAEFSVDNGFGA